MTSQIGVTENYFQNDGKKKFYRYFIKRIKLKKKEQTRLGQVATHLHSTRLQTEKKLYKRNIKRGV